jgi:DNA-binding SARP family transcriptional activator/ActR/RegA family two-component response regulator
MEMQEHSMQGSPWRILVIMGDSRGGDTLRQTLQGEGYAVDEATSMDEGFALLQNGVYQVLLLDLLLPPEGSGLHVLETLRAAPSIRPAAVIVLTPIQSGDLARMTLAVGANDYLVVPYTTGDLILRVQLALSRATPTPNHSPLRIYSLGGFYVEGGSEVRLQQGGRMRKAVTLFKYMLTHKDRAIPTAEVLELLWPDSIEDLAATNLRSLLSYLRHLLGVSARSQPFLEHTSTSLRLQLSPIDWWDVEDFTASLAQGMKWRQLGDATRALQAYTAAVARYRGDYLEEDAYSDWTQPMRERLREEWLEALNTMAVLHREKGDDRQQEAVLRTLLRAAPYREHTYRALMMLLVEQGRSAEALVHYRQLSQLLQVELQTNPDPATRALAMRIREATIVA